MFYYDIISSPLGQLLLVTSEKGLKQISFEDQIQKMTISDDWEKNPDKLKPVTEQLLAYFNQKLTKFTLELDPDGTIFQKQIWNQLSNIPFGELRSYQDIANAIDKPNACRAVGMANSKNPIPIIVPCHRVIGKNGKLTGYAGGLDIKAKLLEIEGIDQRKTPKQFQLF